MEMQQNHHILKYVRRLARLEDARIVTKQRTLSVNINLSHCVPGFEIYGGHQEPEFSLAVKQH